MAPMKNKLQRAKAATQDIYERNAVYWDKIRSRKLCEKVWLDRMIVTLPPQSPVLDLGCGTGDPISGYFIKKGFEIVGLDYSKNMIDLAKAKYPTAEWIVADMRTLPDIGMFDGIYSWDGFFHLSTEEQRKVLPTLSSHIKPGGTLMLTVGTGEGEVTGKIGAETVYHASLSPEEYKTSLHKYGFRTVTYETEDPDCQGRSVLLASQMSISL